MPPTTGRGTSNGGFEIVGMVLMFVWVCTLDIQKCTSGVSFALLIQPAMTSPVDASTVDQGWSTPSARDADVVVSVSARQLRPSVSVTAMMTFDEPVGGRAFSTVVIANRNGVVGVVPPLRRIEPIATTEGSTTGCGA